MNLGEVRSRVRTQLDVDDVELTDAHLDWFVKDGYNATLSIETRWPFFQELWEFTASGPTEALQASTREIVSLYDVTEGRILEFTYPNAAIKRWGEPVTTGQPQYWTVYYGDPAFSDGALTLWPGASTPRDFSAETFRKPEDWMVDDTTEMDCDRRLQDAVVLYTCARAYQKQEDPMMADMYFASWEQKTNQTHDDIMRPNRYRPRILNRGIKSRLGRVSVDFP